MSKFTFKGGIHPREMKELSNKCPIQDAFPSTRMVTIPVTMGGAPNTPCVAVGDLVAKGQIIANGDKFMNCPVHSSVSGKVKKIQNCLVTGNQEVPCIIIQADEENRTEYMEALDPFTCDPADALKRIKDAGIVGMGGASFPAHVKLNPPEDKTIDYVLVNAAECEPYLTCDERTLQEDTFKVIDGLAIECRIVGAQGIIVLEENKEYIKPKLLQEINDKGYADDISICVVKTKYPQGSEKFIVKSALGIEIPSAKLPADAGTIISNVGTLCAISDAFRLGKPLIERALTISGEAIEKPCNLRVPVGTLISDLSPEYFKLKENMTAKIISGGPMMENLKEKVHACFLQRCAKHLAYLQRAGEVKQVGIHQVVKYGGILKVLLGQHRTCFCAAAQHCGVILMFKCVIKGYRHDKTSIKIILWYNS